VVLLIKIIVLVVTVVLTQAAAAHCGYDYGFGIDSLSDCRSGGYCRHRHLGGKVSQAPFRCDRLERDKQNTGVLIFDLVRPALAKTSRQVELSAERFDIRGYMDRGEEGRSMSATRPTSRATEVANERPSQV